MLNLAGNSSKPPTPLLGLRGRSLTDVLPHDLLLCVADHLSAVDLARAGATSRRMHAVELARWRAIWPLEAEKPNAPELPLEAKKPNASKLAWGNALKTFEPAFRRVASRAVPVPDLSAINRDALASATAALERTVAISHSLFLPAASAHTQMLAERAGVSLALLQALESAIRNPTTPRRWEDRAAQVVGSGYTFAAALLAAAAWVLCGEPPASAARTEAEGVPELSGFYLATLGVAIFFAAI